MSLPRYQGVFFDLDGTLADTAPDLVRAANLLRTTRQLEPLALELLRPKASAGARGLIYGAFGYNTDHPDFETLRDEFLSHYENAICVDTKLFTGMNEVLDHLEKNDITWGIVTNKQSRFTEPLLQKMGLHERSQANVSGDTTPFAKPHPEPLLHAAKLCGVTPSQCLYVGDDLRDIVAGKAAGMTTVAAAYGYCDGEQPVSSWDADYIIHHPSEIIDLIHAK